MKAFFLPALIVATFLAGCATPERYAENQAATVNWLNSHVGRSTIDLSGTWYSEDWGSGYISQSKGRLTGYLDKYQLAGVVNGRTAYIAISEDGWTYYSAVLHANSPTVLMGKYSRGVPFDPVDSWPMRLDKLNR